MADVEPESPDVNGNDSQDQTIDEVSEPKVSEPKMSESKNQDSEQSGLEAADIVEDAIQLTVDDELKDSCHIWVSGLSQKSAKANDLQDLFAAYGKVMSCKIITNPRLPAASCYGLITMESAQQVNECISHLNRKEFNGKKILLSRNRPQESSKTALKPKTVVKRSTKKTLDAKKTSEAKKEKKDKGDGKEKGKEDGEKKGSKEEKDGDKKGEGDDDKDKIRERSRSRSRSRSIDRRRFMFRDRRIPLRRPMGIGFRRPMTMWRPHFFMRGGGPHNMGRRPFIAHQNYSPMIAKKLEFERNMRERERYVREERRKDDFIRMQRDIDRKQREEQLRLEREKEKLRIERERLDREKAELLKFEREKQKMEREQILREREELRRRQAQLPMPRTINEEPPRTRPSIVSAAKRPYERPDFRGNDNYWDERKRLQHGPRIESHLIPGRFNSDNSGGARQGAHGFDNRNDNYKRAKMEMPIISGGSGRADLYEARRHDSRHSGHDRDERKPGGPGFYGFRGGDSRPPISRDRRIGVQRDDWKNAGHERRFNDKSGGSGFTPRSYATAVSGDVRTWSDRGSSSLGKGPYGTGNVVSQPWSSSGERWNFASGSSAADSRTRTGQSSLNSSMISGTSSITNLFSSNPINPMSMNNLSHISGNSNLGASERPYGLHGNRRF